MPDTHTASPQAFTAASELPIGVFDSGVGGLSVLQELQRELPHERFVYVSDAGHAPYGEKDDQTVLERSQVIARYLCEHHHIKALVVACNTATAASIGALRAAYHPLPIIGIEPAIKPALAQTRTGKVAVMATRGTLSSQKFRGLMATLPQADQLILQACDGLADAIERNDATKTEALCAMYTRSIGQFGTQANEIDTLVLGCTHYPFARAILRQLVGDDVVFLEGGAPVARQTRKLLDASSLLSKCTQRGSTHFLTSGEIAPMAHAIAQWLSLVPDVERLPPQQAR